MRRRGLLGALLGVVGLGVGSSAVSQTSAASDEPPVYEYSYLANFTSLAEMIPRANKELAADGWIIQDIYQTGASQRDLLWHLVARRLKGGVSFVPDDNVAWEYKYIADANSLSEVVTVVKNVLSSDGWQLWRVFAAPLGSSPSWYAVLRRARQ